MRTRAGTAAKWTVSSFEPAGYAVASPSWPPVARPLSRESLAVAWSIVGYHAYGPDRTDIYLPSPESLETLEQAVNEGHVMRSPNGAELDIDGVARLLSTDLPAVGNLNVDEIVEIREKSPHSRNGVRLYATAWRPLIRHDHKSKRRANCGPD